MRDKCEGLCERAVHCAINISKDSYCIANGLRVGRCRMTQSQPIDVLYIAGYGRSGSTVLDMLLGSNPHMISMSELTHIFDFWEINSECSCGKPFRECDFWNRVFENIDTTGAAKATRRIQVMPLWLSAVFQRRERKQYARAWRQLLEAPP